MPVAQSRVPCGSRTKKCIAGSTLLAAAVGLLVVFYTERNEEREHADIDANVESNLGETYGQAAGSYDQHFLVGADITRWRNWSYYSWKSNGKNSHPITMLAEAGANIVRNRLWVNPENSRWKVPPDSDIESVLETAKLVHAAGMGFYLDFFYADGWAGAGNQPKASIFQNKPFPEIVKLIREYTVETLNKFVTAGVTPKLVQVGNEIMEGMLFEKNDCKNGAEITCGGTKSFTNVVALLNSAIAGVREVLGQDYKGIVVHLEDGPKVPLVLEWLRGATAAGLVGFDIVGLSYYQRWDGMHASDHQLGAHLGKIVKAFPQYKYMISETDYPYLPIEEPSWTKYPRPGQQTTKPEYPYTLWGQARFTRNMIDELHSVPALNVVGMCWWGGELRNGYQGATSSLWNRWGIALPALSELHPPQIVVAADDAYDYDYDY